MPTRGKSLSRTLVRCFLFLALAGGAVGQLPVRPTQPPPPDLDMIVSYVSVTASKGIAPRLTARDFQILEDNKEQKIEYFAVLDQPATVGILWAAGTGFDDPAPESDVRACPREFIKNMPLGSEYFLLSGDKVTTPYTMNLNSIPQNFAWSGASSDSIYLGLDILKEGAHPRKLLFVIMNPDGGSGGQLQNDYVERVAINQGYQIHVITFISAPGETNLPGQVFLEELTQLTGGSFTLSTVSNVICSTLAKELRVQYMIGFHPTNSAKDGKWRKLGVKVNAPDDGPKLKARIKRGYYAAKESR